MKKTQQEAKQETRPAKVERFVQSLKVNLTTEELLKRGARSADLIASIQQKDADMKAAQKAMKSEIETMEAELNQLAVEISTKAAYRNTDCERVYDYEKGRVDSLRLDTMDIFDSRKMTEAELQPELDFGESNGQPQDEEWKKTPVREALPDLGKRIHEGIEKLLGPDATIGGLFDWKNGNDNRRWTDIDGLGEAGATKIDDAIEAFWNRQE